MPIVHDNTDHSGRYRVLVESTVFAGFITTYRVRVIDLQTRSEVEDDEIYHSDADAACEGWAMVSALLARHRTRLQGAYVIGASEY